MTTPVKEEFKRRGIGVLNWAICNKLGQSTAHNIARHGWLAFRGPGSPSHKIAKAMASDVGMTMEEAFGPKAESEQ